MTQTFECPNCRAALEVDPDNTATSVKCKYCLSTVVVPETLRKQDRQPSLQRIEVNLSNLAGAGSAYSGAEYPSRTGRRLLGCVAAAIVLFALAATLIPVLLGGSLLSLGTGRAEDLLGTALPGANLLATSLPGATSTPGLAQLAFQFGGQEGTGPGFFNDTRRIGVDSSGRIYTGDYSGGRIQVFDAAGSFLATWNAGSDLYMSAMAVDPQGRLYVIDGNDVKAFDGMTGAPLPALALPPDGGGTFGYSRLATAADGSLVVASEERILRLDAQGQLTLDAPIDSAIASTFQEMAVDGAGNIYLLGNDAVHIFNSSGQFLDRIGSQGDAPDQFQTSPTALAVDGGGRIFAADFDGIKVFEAGGRYLGLIEMDGVPFGMVFNNQNELLVMDRNGNRVLKYTLNQ